MFRLLPLTLSALIVCAGALLAGCGGSSGSGLVVYSGQHEQTTAALVSRFERLTGIHVAVRSGDEQSLGNQVLQEGAASPADVFLSENSPVLESLREHGRLAAVAPATLAAVPSRYSATSGRWVGLTARVSALVYNTSRLRPAQLPSSILTLAEPQWRGKLAFAPTETDFQPLVTAVIKLDGEAAAERWLKGMQANGATYPDNETVTTQVNNGQSAIGPIDHYYWYRLRRELGSGGVHSALHFLAAGDPGLVVNVAGAGVLSSAPHAAAAQRFLAFLASAEGQQAIANSASYEYPLRPGVAAAPGLPPLSSFQPAPLTPAELGDGAAALALEQRLGLV